MNILLFWFSYLFTRRSNLWAFGCPRNEFVGNSKYLYLWITANRPDICAVWITANKAVYDELKGKGYRVVKRGSIASIFIALRAKLHIYCASFDEVYYPFSGGSKSINLWHGVGIKQVEYLMSNGKLSNALRRSKRNPIYRLADWKRFHTPDMVLSTSEMMSSHFSKCFRIPLECCPKIGYPRMDVASDDKLKSLALSFGDYSSFLDTVGKASESYIYMPTWRESARDFISEAFPYLSKLSQILAKRNAVLFVKLHPNTKRTISDEFPNIKTWPKDLDIYPVLDRFNVLLTDYSSILYDWIFFKDNGVILYSFDYDEYSKSERDLAFSFEDNIIGARADSFESLCDIIKSGAGLAKLPTSQLSTLRERFWGNSPRSAAPDLTTYLKRLAS